MKPSSTRSPTGTATNTSRQYGRSRPRPRTLGESSTPRTRLGDVARQGREHPPRRPARPRGGRRRHPSRGPLSAAPRAPLDRSRCPPGLGATAARRRHDRRPRRSARGRARRRRFVGVVVRRPVFVGRPGRDELLHARRRDRRRPTEPARGAVARAAAHDSRSSSPPGSASGSISTSVPVAGSAGASSFGTGGQRGAISLASVSRLGVGRKQADNEAIEGSSHRHICEPHPLGL